MDHRERRTLEGRYVFCEHCDPWSVNKCSPKHQRGRKRNFERLRKQWSLVGKTGENCFCDTDAKNEDFLYPSCATLDDMLRYLQGFGPDSCCSDGGCPADREINRDVVYATNKTGEERIKSDRTISDADDGSASCDCRCSCCRRQSAALCCYEIDITSESAASAYDQRSSSESDEVICVTIRGTHSEQMDDDPVCNCKLHWQLMRKRSTASKESLSKNSIFRSNHTYTTTRQVPERVSRTHRESGAEEDMYLEEEEAIDTQEELSEESNGYENIQQEMKNACLQPEMDVQSSHRMYSKTQHSSRNISDTSKENVYKQRKDLVHLHEGEAKFDENNMFYKEGAVDIENERKKAVNPPLQRTQDKDTRKIQHRHLKWQQLSRKARETPEKSKSYEDVHKERSDSIRLQQKEAVIEENKILLKENAVDIGNVSKQFTTGALHKNQSMNSNTKYLRTEDTPRKLSEPSEQSKVGDYLHIETEDSTQARKEKAGLDENRTFSKDNAVNADNESKQLKNSSATSNKLSPNASFGTNISKTMPESFERNGIDEDLYLKHEEELQVQEAQLEKDETLKVDSPARIDTLSETSKNATKKRSPQNSANFNNGSRDQYVKDSSHAVLLTETSSAKDKNADAKTLSELTVKNSKEKLEKLQNAHKKLKDANRGEMINAHECSCEENIGRAVQKASTTLASPSMSFQMSEKQVYSTVLSKNRVSSQTFEAAERKEMKHEEQLNTSANFEEEQPLHGSYKSVDVPVVGKEDLRLYSSTNYVVTSAETVTNAHEARRKGSAAQDHQKMTLHVTRSTQISYTNIENKACQIPSNYSGKRNRDSSSKVSHLTARALESYTVKPAADSRRSINSAHEKDTPPQAQSVHHRGPRKEVKRSRADDATTARHEGKHRGDTRRKSVCRNDEDMDAIAKKKAHRRRRSHADEGEAEKHRNGRKKVRNNYGEFRPETGKMPFVDGVADQIFGERKRYQNKDFAEYVTGKNSAKRTVRRKWLIKEVLRHVIFKCGSWLHCQPADEEELQK